MTQELVLYQFPACPFCQRVLRQIEQLDLDIELRDTRRDPEARQELQQGGGRTMVPCLRITKDDGSVEWMYESEDINRFLVSRYGNRG
ncbi:glutaredoxin family protein [Kushneria phosphatilytica]|uniref:Glutaredoxin n=1 Tax=Kushneria phosphatilytica TaxID=657387 RepID=A0A1S1NX52_9GAMM|nr:glutaredoxin [Kushneria phosphatilytica]OHV10583.1 hypothetical protein BH688_09370 [Kushneria phosphatilytica]QEL11839.1 glutaredoxin [Kushneria phosphatilytica]